MISSKACNPLLDERRNLFRDFLQPNMLRCPRRSASRAKTARGSRHRKQSPNHIVPDLWNPGTCLPQRETADFLPSGLGFGPEMCLFVRCDIHALLVLPWVFCGLVWYTIELVEYTLHMSIYIHITSLDHAFKYIIYMCVCNYINGTCRIMQIVCVMIMYM